MKVAYSRLSGAGKLEYVRAIPAPASLALLVAALGGIFLLDRATGAARVQHLYYLPLIFASLRFGRNAGLASSACAILLYHLANPPLLQFRHTELDLLQIVIFAAVAATTAKLAEDTRRLRTLAATDDLTGLANLRGFESRLEQMIASVRLAEGHVSMLVLDVDRLKSLNDRHGHLAGADAVRLVGQILAALTPAGSVACRYGGDEFAVALPYAGDRAFRLAEAIRMRVRQTVPEVAGLVLPAGTISVSVGVASKVFSGECPIRSDTEEARQLFRAADEALYEAKRAGRDRTGGSMATQAIPGEH